LAIVATAAQALRLRGRQRELRHPSILLLVLLVVQIALGALTVLSRKQFIINSLHVVTGALVLGTSLVLTLRAHWPRLAGSEDPAYEAMSVRDEMDVRSGDDMGARRAGLQTRHSGAGARA
jgi:heme A synthase